MSEKKKRPTAGYAWLTQNQLALNVHVDIDEARKKKPARREDGQPVFLCRVELLPKAEQQP